MNDLALDFEPRLVEESVLLAIEGAPASDRARFRRERDTLYELTDDRAREAGFQELAGRWFASLGLGKSLLQALAEQPEVVRWTSRQFVLPAPSPKEETADLYENRDPSRTPLLVIRLRPSTLVDGSRLLPFLRHELQHVADMLDPEFGYERASGGDASPAYESLLRERYHVLWDMTVDGRLLARGLLHPAVEERRRREFAATFAALGAEVDECFERYFRGPRPRHHDLWAFALKPVTTGATPPKRAGTRCCPLCGLPSATFHTNPESLSSAVLSQIEEDFPSWNREHGLCLQCADLYASRAVLEALP